MTANNRNVFGATESMEDVNAEGENGLSSDLNRKAEVKHWLNTLMCAYIIRIVQLYKD